MASRRDGVKEFYKEFGDTDLYEFLGVNHESSEREITSAYRRKALKYHPDKNSDENSTVMFRKLTNIYAILTDCSARRAYDNFIKTRLAVEKRRLELSSKRRKLMEDLERKERERPTSATVGEEAATRKMEKEITRLRKEGEERLRAETERLREEMAAGSGMAEGSCILKVKWKCSNEGDGRVNYNAEILKEIFSKYGDCTVVLSKNKGRAVVEFDSVDCSHLISKEEGNPDNPMKCQWIKEPKRMSSVDIIPSVPSETVTVRDYESLTLMKLRQVEERKRLREKLEQEYD